MDIVRIKLYGNGFDVVRWVIPKQDYDKLGDSLNDVWGKDLNKKLRKKVKNFVEDFHDYGITKGDIIISVNDEELMNIPINVLGDYSFNDADLIDIEGYQYPVTNNVIITSVQSLEGVFMDVIFITEEDFNINKLKFIQKVVQDENENILIDSLISEVYYNGQQIIFTGNNTDLRMVRIYYDNGDKEKILKNEKDDN